MKNFSERRDCSRSTISATTQECSNRGKIYKFGYKLLPHAAILMSVSYLTDYSWKFIKHYLDFRYFFHLINEIRVGDLVTFHIVFRYFKSVPNRIYESGFLSVLDRNVFTSS